MSFQLPFGWARGSIQILCASLAASTLLIACGEDDQVTTAQPPNEGGDTDGQINPASPLYGLAVSVFNPDASQTYLLTTSDLSARDLDVRGQGIELPGYLFPFTHEGAIYVPNDDGPTVTRYALGESDTLEEGPTLSFASRGYSAVMDSFHLPVLSSSKAYAIDPPNSRIYLWNPGTMTLLDGEIDISMIQRDGYVARIAADADSARQQDNLLFVPVGWEDAITEDARRASGMLVIDTTTDTVVSFLEDERCTEFQSSVRAPSGDLYFFTSEHSIVTISGGDPEYPSCVLRIRAGEAQFDPDFMLNLSTLTGRPIACCGASGGGSTAYVPVLYEERVGVSDRRELWSEANNDYRYWRVDLETSEASEISSLPFFNSGGPNVYELSNGQVYRALTLRPEEGPDESTLLELTSAQEPVMGPSFQGSLTLLAQLR